MIGMVKDLFVNKVFNYVVVGASQNKNKYGYRVLMDLRGKGFKVFPVNPKYDEIEGIKCYPDLGELPDRPDVVVFVVPPETGREVIKNISEAGIDKVWCQPGSESDEIREYARTHNIDIIADGSCIMTYTRNLI